MALKLPAPKAAEIAIGSIGCGYDISEDLRLKYCKGDSKRSRLIEIDEDGGSEIVLPGGILLPNVSKSIKCDKGERTRFRSDVLSFQQMSEQFNQDINLTGKIPSGHFNAMFEFSGCWQKDAANTKTLAFDGVFITLYTVALEKSQMVFCDHVMKAVPSSWDPSALARFINTFGTHVVVSIKMGGKDVIYVKQQHSSTLQPADVQKRLKEMADKRFSDANGQNGMVSERVYQNEKGTASEVCRYQSIEFLFTQGDKPPIEELHQFLDFQLPRQWAPVFSDLPLGPQRRQQSSPSLQFSLMGPKLYVNTTPVDVSKRPVTGLRLYLEGKRSNRLAIHLQHLLSLPKIFQLEDDPSANFRQDSFNHRYYEKVQWKSFSHVCTAPVESDEDLSIVTGAQLQVENHGFKNILFLRLRFSTVVGAMIAKRPEWDGSPGLAPKSGLISTLISHHFTTAQKAPPRLADVNINSAVYPGGPPSPVQAPKLLKFVDATEMVRGPQDTPGYWIVSGARLLVEKGRISLRVKYSLLTVILPDEEVVENP
ncbi:MACPF domain-containing protein At4g24290-like isoform X2 [Juglans microcarpa x Juglans regia]|uniref:MACPF domain-containing protein At4g24290-like isoform X2 n=1 Tax=Juglans microcarpa x Juglans regia TaxID=2249226 RepID=UPI001B7D9D12|nr:MACPF domain-containing protein At4g24290-like isoform X2 [Juglans microcarpa x Juglans regia]